MTSLFLTYAVHSTVLGLVALALLAAADALRGHVSPAARAVVLRAALLGPLASTAIAFVAQGEHAPQASGAPTSLADGVGGQAAEPQAGQPQAGQPQAAQPEAGRARFASEAAEGGLGASAPLALRARATAVPTGPRTRLLAWGAVALGAWALGVLLVRELRARRVLAARRPVSDAELLGIARALLPGRSVRLTECRGLATPLTLGRNEVVLPRDLTQRLTPGEREALLAHELAHVARRDPLWLGLARCVAAATVFQPVQRRLLHRLEDETELAADAWAAARTLRPLELARCLERFSTQLVRSVHPASSVASIAMARPGSCVVRRVEQLCRPSLAGERPRVGLVSGCAIAAIVIAGCAGPSIQSRPTEGETEDRAQESHAAPESLATDPIATEAPFAPFEVTPYTGPDAVPNERRFKLSYDPSGGLARLPQAGPRLDSAAILEVLRGATQRGTIPGTELEGSLDRLVVEAPADAPFRYAQLWFAAVAAPELSVWKTELAVVGDAEITSVFLPVDSCAALDEVPEELPEDGASAGGRSGLGDPDERRRELRIDRDPAGGVRYTMGPRRWVDVAAVLASLRTLQSAAPDLEGIVVDVRPGVLFGDVVPLVRGLQALGQVVTFTGSYESTGDRDRALGLTDSSSAELQRGRGR